MNTAENVRNGSCLCGGVTFRLRGDARDVVICHCSQCRKQTGHVMAATAIGRDHLVIDDDSTLDWYRSSPSAERGFCKRCGSTLFWRRDGRDYVAVAAGSLEDTKGLKIAGHVFADDKGDYYDILDGDFVKPATMDP